MSENKESLHGIIKFIVKILVLGGGHYYFSSRIFHALEQNDIQGAAVYSTIFAGVVLLLLIMFRWSGFFSRLIAAIIGVGVFASILAMHYMVDAPVNTTFVMLYGAITLVSIILSFFILFKGRR